MDNDHNCECSICAERYAQLRSSAESVPARETVALILAHKMPSLRMANDTPGNYAYSIADEIVAALFSALPQPPSQWQPIETAPKDNRNSDLIDIWTVGWGAEPHRVSDCYYDHICGEWRTSRPAGKLLCIKERYVTHWMRRPISPLSRPHSSLGQPLTVLTVDLLNPVAGDAK